MGTVGRSVDDRIYSDDGHWWWDESSSSWHPVQEEQHSSFQSNEVSVTDGVIAGDVIVNQNSPDDIAKAMMLFYQKLGLVQYSSEGKNAQNDNHQENLVNSETIVNDFSVEYYSNVSNILGKV